MATLALTEGTMQIGPIDKKRFDKEERCFRMNLFKGGDYFSEFNECPHD
jgi:hypothetical protein